MNVYRSTEAIRDLLDIAEIYSDRCYYRGFPREGDEFLSIARRIYNRFEEVSKGNRQNETRAWSALHHTLSRCERRADHLRKLQIIDKEELLFIRECMEEVHKYIRRYFAKRDAPDWRRGA
ncbi:hypothetical protein [Phaeocystidibacter luteus]|uniref:Four helix bundle protein n=1 Tax=Phaeocystidibacter luteus TaxID=911197 RepID=A0A6N6RMF1_9FLAO|nr:hypothetical protein [Phaeocystidibacter luteus]KAB2814738.1 hypothetical protein F8C67_03055 [Phaeocystidibacter luteus]